MGDLLALPAGTELVDDFVIERVLGAGGFGITYLAREVALARQVTIKEYFPTDFAGRNGELAAVPRSEGCADDYRWGLDRFIEEAQILARFDHPNIVRVYRYFRANNTAYMVLRFEQGQSLKSWLAGLRRAPRQRELDKILVPLLDALEVIHRADFLHRDIAPDNIIIRKDGSPILIDFGSARGDIARHTRTVSALVKPGYSPYEQYAETGFKQGPWTDIYALGATLYHGISGKRPPDAPTRLIADEVLPAHQVALSSYRASFLDAVDRALALHIDKRPSSVAAWRGGLLAPDPAKPGWFKRTMSTVTTSRAAPQPQPAAIATTLPLPPDVPDRKGSLVNYIDSVQRNLDGPTAASVPGKIAAALSSEGQAPDSAPARSGPKIQRPAVSRRLRSRSRPVGPTAARQKRSWRPLAFRLAVGAGIAALAVNFQDGLPSLPTHGSGAVASAVREPASPTQLPGHAGGTTAVAYPESSATIVTAGADGTIKSWDRATGKMIRSIDLDSGPATALAVFGRRALTGHAEGELVLWDIDSGEKLGTYKRNGASIWSVAFAGEPDRFLAASHDWAVSLWDARGGELPTFVLEGHDSAVQAVAYSRTGPYVASGGADRSVKLWNPASGYIRSYRGHRDFVTALAFSPDGKFLASASLDGSIRLWPTSGSRLYRVLAGHRGRVSAVAFSPDGHLLASASEDGTVRLWDFRHNRVLKALGTGGTAIKAIAFAPDGKRVAAASGGGEVLLWDATVLPRIRQ